MLYLMALSDAVEGVHDQVLENIAMFGTHSTDFRWCYWRTLTLSEKITCARQRNWYNSLSYMI